MTRHLAALAGLLVLTFAHARAEPRVFLIQPGSGSVAFRAYGLGMLPIDGAFARFAGRFTLDLTDPSACRLVLRVETGSLEMGGPVITADATGPDLLDVAKYPELSFAGECRAGAIDGVLLLHGISRRISLPFTVTNGRWMASGNIRRAEWGMGARPLLAGPEVRLEVTVALPSGFPKRP